MDIIIAGVGGQGTILAAKILAEAAMAEGLRVRTGETIGMSQRGGSVVSHVRIGESTSPYIPAQGADLLLALELCEGARQVRMLKPAAPAVVAQTVIMPVTASLGLATYDAEAMRQWIQAGRRAFFSDPAADARAVQAPKAANVALLGTAFALGFLPFAEATLLAALAANMPAAYKELNIQAWYAGAKNLGDGIARPASKTTIEGGH
jgi:indolepyruvate ferredoxin oxidoreductase beta subunit